MACTCSLIPGWFKMPSTLLEGKKAAGQHRVATPKRTLQAHEVVRGSSDEGKSQSGLIECKARYMHESPWLW